MQGKEGGLLLLLLPAPSLEPQMVHGSVPPRSFKPRRFTETYIAGGSHPKNGAFIHDDLRLRQDVLAFGKRWPQPASQTSWFLTRLSLGQSSGRVLRSPRTLTDTLPAAPSRIGVYPRRLPESMERPLGSQPGPSRLGALSLGRYGERPAAGAVTKGDGGNLEVVDEKAKDHRCSLTKKAEGPGDKPSAFPLLMGLGCRAFSQGGRVSSPSLPAPSPSRQLACPEPRQRAGLPVPSPSRQL